MENDMMAIIMEAGKGTRMKSKKSKLVQKIYGKEIVIDYMKTEYNIDLKNYDDSACMIYDLKKQPVYSGGSGPACLPLVTYSYIFDLMKKKKLTKVLLVATGSLHSTTSVNEKRSIPSIAHAISLEVSN